MTQKTETLTYYEKLDPKDPKTAKRSQIFKDADFGGGSGSGGGADDTKYTESLQWFLLFLRLQHTQKENQWK